MKFGLLVAAVILFLLSAALDFFAPTSAPPRYYAGATRAIGLALVAGALTQG